jgi:CHASE2 domain-containing sensor protein
MEKPARDRPATLQRFELARLIELASQSGARGVALDFYFGREPSDVDAFLCQVVNRANDTGKPVIAGQKIVRGDGPPVCRALRRHHRTMLPR